jgi:hypothetical protein
MNAVSFGITCRVSSRELPEDVQQLLKEQIRSIEQLEILLLLREAPEKTWTAATVYQTVRSSERSVSATLDHLARSGFLSRSEGSPPAFQYAPQSTDLGVTVGRLAHLYVERRVRIVEAIYSERVSAVDEFAKAFRLRKDPNG